MTKISAKEALSLWEQAGLLDKHKVRELTEFLAAQPAASGTHRAVYIFAAIGAVLVGLGLIMFVASHWGAMSPVQRGITLFSAYGVIVGLAAVVSRRGYPAVAEALWFVATLTLGANIFLFGQMFNFSLTYWQGPLLWMIGALAMGYAIQSRLHAWIVMPLSLLALGWMGGGSGWFTDDQWEFLVRSTGLIPLLGLGWVCLGLLARGNEQWRFAAGTWLIWGALLITVPLLIGTMDDWFFQRIFRIGSTLKHLIIVAAIIALLLITLVYGEFRTWPARLIFIGVALLLLLLGIPAEIEPFALLHDKSLFVWYVLLVFVLSLTLIWSGVGAANARLVNVGMGSAAFIILVQYFSWSFRLLDRSLAFVAGGLVLITLAIWFERQRRKLLARIAP